MICDLTFRRGCELVLEQVRLGSQRFRSERFLCSPCLMFGSDLLLHPMPCVQVLKVCEAVHCWLY